MQKLLLLFIFNFFPLFSQTTNQIEKARSIIKNNGLTDTQIKDAAKSQGYSDDQVKLFLEQEGSLKNGKENPELSLPNVADKLKSEESNKIIKDYSKHDNLENYEDESGPEIINGSDQNLSIKTSNDKKREVHFGYDIFSRDPALFQASSAGAVDPNYLVGPSDEIIVMLWGETQFRQVLTVDREGFVFIPEIGQVFVNGLNMTLLESKLFRVFSQSYASLNPQGGTPTTFLDVSLGGLRPLRIQVLGEVAQPGAYTVSPSATLFSSLYYFNGPTIRGSLRDIQLIRGSEKIKSIDFYDFLLTGKKIDDQKLQLDDVIFIPRRKKSVTIKGEVNRNGIFELKSDESLKDLIEFAGGLKITAFLDRAQIDRISSFQERDSLKIDRKFQDVDLKKIIEKQNIVPLQDGDEIKIFSISENRQNLVSVTGSVNRPGIYELEDSLRISDLIIKADGLMGDAFLERVDLVRTKSDFSKELLKLDLKQAIENNYDHNIILKDGDRLKIYGMNEMIPRSYISIIGHVKKPGIYPLLTNMTLYDLIFQSGGSADELFIKNTFLERAELVRSTEDNNTKKIIPFSLGKVLKKEGIADEKLQPNDLVEIFSLSDTRGGKQFIEIEGHVKRPGKYELFKENMKIYDLIFKAGGFDDPLFKSGTYLEKADLLRLDKDRITQNIITFNLNEILLDQNSDQNIFLVPGDKIIVYSEKIFNAVKPVSIYGIVQKPGTYDFKNNMKLKDLILEAGGVKQNILKYKVEVSRIDSSNKSLNSYATTESFDLDQIRNSSNNLYDLQPFDFVYIRPDPFFRNQKQVEISGEVLYPGKYTILKLDEKITDIIKRSGGVRENAYLKGSKYLRLGKQINVDFDKISKKPKSPLNFNVQEGDKIIIVQSPNVVFISGAVNTDGVHKYVKGKRMRYYINQAGGFSPKYDSKNIWIEYPNGDSKKYSRFSLLSPKIYDGSVLNVGIKEEKEPFDSTEFAKEFTSILANFAQVITIIILAFNNG